MTTENIKDRYELAIIGCGPAGMAAALNAKIRNKDFILLGTEYGGSKLAKAPQVENYLGFPKISGLELRRHFQEHLQSMDIQAVKQKVNAVYPGSRFTLALPEQVIEADAVILATGVSAQKVFPGEAELLGRGVGYCATCDGPLYRNKSVAILAYAAEGEHDANYLAELCTKVYYIPFYKEVGVLDPRLEIRRAAVKSIMGQNKVEGLELAGETLTVDGVFVVRESLPAEQLVSGLALEQQAIKTDPDFSTNIRGLFAAGDCTGPPYQLLKAVGEGATAALAAIRYLDELKQQK